MRSSATERGRPATIEPKPGSIEVTMPETDARRTPAMLVAWHVRPGGEVSEDAPICTVQIHGAVATVTSPASGRLRTLKVGVRALVEPGESLALIEPLPESVPEPPPDAEPEPEVQPEPEAHIDSEPGPARPLAHFYSPAVRNLASAHDVDLESITGTGRDGRVTRDDILAKARDAGSQAESKLPSSNG
jgi:pyruvate/2-oxoglutarate dehydrogenase complex dihydrolipoamide acyltransferase (E2) component